MPRPKGSTNKKKVTDDISFREETLEETVVKEHLIASCGFKFNNEEMNLLVDKLNEVITHINNG